MRIRKLLLVHPSRSIRALIMKYVYAEMSDIEIAEAEGGRQSLDLMATAQFDIIACSDQLRDMAITELKTQMQATPTNVHTPMIIISESESNHVRNELVALGFDRIVQIRVRPADLIYKINALCNPRKWRRDTRYHIPNMAVTITMQQRKFEGFPVNISLGGLLVEMSIDQPDLLMKEAVDITLRIPMANGQDGIEGLKAKLLRLESVRWNPDLTPAVMRVTFIFQNMPDAQRMKLEKLLQAAHADKLTDSAMPMAADTGPRPPGRHCFGPFPKSS